MNTTPFAPFAVMWIMVLLGLLFGGVALLAWLLRDDRVTSVLIGASRAEQVTDCVGALANSSFSPEELAAIEAILARHAAAAGGTPRR